MSSCFLGPRKACRVHEGGRCPSPRRAAVLVSTSGIFEDDNEDDDKIPTNSGRTCSYIYIYIFVKYIDINTGGSRLKISAQEQQRSQSLGTLRVQEQRS